MIIELYLYLVVDLCFVLLLLFFPYFINEMDIVLSICWPNIKDRHAGFHA